jgi:hypothetical protein
MDRVTRAFFKHNVPTVYIYEMDRVTRAFRFLPVCLAEEIERKKARREVAIIAVLADIAEPIKTTVHQNSGVLYFCCSYRVS